MTDKNIKALLDKMEEEGVDYYLIDSSDPHMSEYVCDHFRIIRFLTGFTGENATLIVSKSECGLWVDGRFFIQAKKEVEGSGVTIYEMDTEGVPSVEDYLKEKLPENGVLGFDGRILSCKKRIRCQLASVWAGATMRDDCDLISDIWEDRPPLPCNPVHVLEDEYTGESTVSKLERFREAMKEKAFDSVMIGELNDIAWLLNMRGSDIEYTPVFFSFLFITWDEAVLFANVDAFDEKCRDHLEKSGIILMDYESVYSYPFDEKIKSWIVAEDDTVNAALYFYIGEKGKDKVKLTSGINPSRIFKSVKNETEIENTRKAHLFDGIAVTKFIYSVKNRIGKEDMSELSLMKELHELRAASEDFLGESFETISAYGANAAMMHYTATEETYSPLSPKGFYLVDSGGHYKIGTTDITRTIALGSLSDREKRDYTKVLRAHLRLLMARFPEGVTGYNLDVLSRGVLWDEGLDYRCGTGHGVGNLLSVHDGPNAFRWKAKRFSDLVALQPGMVTTDEPGIYIEGEYGIRIESELLCKKSVKTEYGQFLDFENLTFAPFEREAIVPEMLTQYEREALNDYHKTVYEKLSPHLSDEEREWLLEVTKEI